MGSGEGRWFAGALTAGLLLGAVACGNSAANASPQPPTPSQPAPDPVTQRYVALVHSYWVQYKAAEGVVPRFARVCWGQTSRVAPSDTRVVDPASCRETAAAILPSHESFLSNLDTAPAPAKFAADDQVFRRQLPKAIADVKAMMAAAAAGNREAVLKYMTAYVDDMVPRVTLALDDVDPSVVHD